MRIGGSVSAAVLAMILVGAFGGAVVGLIVASLASSQAVVAFVAALGGGILALVVGNWVFGNSARLSPGSPVVVWNLVVSAVIGAFAGHELAVDIRDPPVSTLIGTASGLFAGVVIASLLATIVWVRNQPNHG